MADEAQTPVQKYLEIVAGYENEFKKWDGRVLKLLKKYRDEYRGQTNNEMARFNILWSNVQTLVPAVYSRMPKASVTRRFVDNDPVGRVAALLIERALDYEIEHYPDFRSAMKDCVTDRFLGGRGVSWVRYEPHVRAQELQVTEDVPDPQDRTGGDEPEPAEEIEYECSPTDYVYWRDFGHNFARTWEEVTCVWRWVYMSETALKARFPETWTKVPLNQQPERLNGNKEKGAADKAKVCELWDKETGKAYWFAKNCPDMLDQVDDPLELEGFFPCAKPLYATTTTDNLIPIPDYVLYQDQAHELDILSDRIDGLVKALRVRGIYDASQPALQRLLTEGDNNTLIPTDKWAAFAEKGGLKGSIDLIPIEIFANALLVCYQARKDVQSQIYEITGISDIVRGQGMASESATAQQIKGQYAGLRLKSMQETVAVFASELLRIKAQIICNKYQDSTILAYAAAQQLSEADQALIPQAMQLLRQKPLRSMRAEVNADSLVQIDEAQIKQERMEFLNAAGTFLREAVSAGTNVPELAPAIMGMFKFGIAGFKQARQLEGTFDVALQELEKKAAEAKANPKPDPEMVKAQAKAQGDAQAAQMKAQADAQLEQVRQQGTAQLEQMRLQHQEQILMMTQAHEASMKRMEINMDQTFRKWEADLKAATAIDVALIGANKMMPGPSAAAAQTLVDSLANGNEPEMPELQTLEQPEPAAPAAAE
jgi:hypothetical protein